MVVIEYFKKKDEDLNKIIFFFDLHFCEIDIFIVLQYDRVSLYPQWFTTVRKKTQ